MLRVIIVKIIQQKTKWKNLELKVISQNKQEVWPTQSIISTKYKDLVLRFLAKKDVRIKDCNKIIKIITSLDIDIMFSYYLYIHSDDMLGFFIPEQY